MKLDSFDIKILGILQSEVDASIAEIAARVNLSSNACWRRIKLLEGAGYILKRVALLDPAKLDVGTTVFVMLRAAEHSEEWLKLFAQAVSALSEVLEVYRMSGDIDYLLKIRVEDIAAYDRVYKKLIKSIRLSDVSSSFAMEEIKYTTELPLPAIR